MSPANLEAALKAQPLVGQACAVGDGEPYIVALVVLDPDVAPVWAARHGIDVVATGRPTCAELARDPRVLEEIAHEVHDANERFSHAEQVRRFLVLGDEWLPDSRGAHAHDEAQASRDPGEVRARDRRARTAATSAEEPAG